MPRNETIAVPPPQPNYIKRPGTPLPGARSATSASSTPRTRPTTPAPEPVLDTQRSATSVALPQPRAASRSWSQYKPDIKKTENGDITLTPEGQKKALFALIWEAQRQNRIGESTQYFNKLCRDVSDMLQHNNSYSGILAELSGQRLFYKPKPSDTTATPPPTPRNRS